MTAFPIVLPSPENPHMTLSREGPLFILHMHKEDNRFTTPVVQGITKTIEIIEDIFYKLEKPEDMALITIGNGKFFSNGLDLKFALGYQPFMDTYLYMLKKMLTFCIPTIAVVNGHAFAGGCMFAFAHDYRIMRSDRGYICMNEVDLPSALAAGMGAIIREKTTPPVYRDMILQGRRFNAQEALECGIVDVIVPEKDLLTEAKELGLKWAHKAKAGIIYKQLKEVMYVDSVTQLSIPFNRFASKL